MLQPEELEKLETMPAGLDVFEPKERFIFWYFNGEKKVPADPLLLYKRVVARAMEIGADTTDANFPGSKTAEQSQDRLEETLRKVFKIKPLEEGGLTYSEMEDLLTKFLDYCTWAKKKWNIVLISPMETSDSTDSSSTEESPTLSTSDSGSTESVSSTGGQRPLPSVQPSVEELPTQAWSIGMTSPTATKQKPI